MYVAILSISLHTESINTLPHPTQPEGLPEVKRITRVKYIFGYVRMGFYVEISNRETA